MEEKRKRKIAPGKFREKLNFFMRLWFTTSNSYSDTIHVNNAKLYRYSDEEKSMFRSGTVLTLKDGNQEFGAIVLAKGTFQKMEQLTDHLEQMAETKCQTGEVLKTVSNLIEQGHPEKSAQSNETDDATDEDLNQCPLSMSGDTQLQREKKKLFSLKRTKRMAPNTSTYSQIFTSSVPSKESAGYAHSFSKEPGVDASSSISKGNAAVAFSSPYSRSPKENSSTSQLVLAELRVHSAVMRQLVDQFKELNQSLRYLRHADFEYPKEDATFDGFEGPFTLSSINASNPNVFARNFLRKKYPLTYLSNRILCPKGKSCRVEFTVHEVESLQRALRNWYGNEFSWKCVVLSVNQFLRDIKDTSVSE